MCFPRQAHGPAHSPGAGRGYVDVGYGSAHWGVWQGDFQVIADGLTPQPGGGAGRVHADDCQCSRALDTGVAGIAATFGLRHRRLQEAVDGPPRLISGLVGRGGCGAATLPSRRWDLLRCGKTPSFRVWLAASARCREVARVTDVGPSVSR